MNRQATSATPVEPPQVSVTSVSAGEPRPYARALNTERFIFWPLLAIVLLAPLPFACVEPWAWALLCVLVGVLLLAWSVLVLMGRATVTVPVTRLWLPIVLFMLPALWAVVQMLPFTPSEWHHPIWQEADELLEIGVRGSISVDPAATAATVTRLLSYGAVFWLAVQFCRDRRLAEYVFYALSLAGFAYAIYGLIIEFTGLPLVLWVEKQAYLDSLTSTFINRNSYATYAGLGLISTTVLITRRLMKLWMPALSRREQIRVFMQEVGEREWMLMLIWLIIGTALFLTDSRAGVFSSCVALLTFISVITITRGVSFRVGAAVLGGALLAMATLFVVSGDRLSDRLGTLVTTAPEYTRQALYDAAIEAIGDAPLLGMGYGTYPAVFHLYRTDNSLLRVRADKAHNTYLENALELGIPATVALNGSILLLALLCARGVRRRRRDIYYPAAGLSASVLVALHSVPDFSLQIPAVAATYSLILAAGCAQSWRTAE